MSSTNDVRLSQSEQDVVHAILVSLNDTRNEPPAERDACLVELANSLLEFQDRVTSFINDSSLAKCAYTIRSEMVRAGFRTNGPFGRIFDDILNFTATISRGRQAVRQREEAAKESRRNAEAAADRRERLEALEYTNNLAKWQKSPLPEDEDTVSLGPENEPESPNGVDDAPVRVPLILKVETNNAPSSMEETIILDQLIARLRLTEPTTPVSPSPSQLVPAPINYPHSSGMTANDPAWSHHRPHTPPLCRVMLPPSIMDSGSNVSLWCRRAADADFLPLKPNFVVGWQESKPAYTGSNANASASRGNFTRSSTPIRGRPVRMLTRAERQAQALRAKVTRKDKKKEKACFFCDSLDHLVLRCPKRNIHFQFFLSPRNALARPFLFLKTQGARSIHESRTRGLRGRFERLGPISSSSTSSMPASSLSNSFHALPTVVSESESSDSSPPLIVDAPSWPGSPNRTRGFGGRFERRKPS
ncbi:hypothetical protein C8F01DRAFT_1079955 [Mycena amicta]|nr:hypothetical protein C8F01DRAFT_1079955 [Mycena amicta]